MGMGFKMKPSIGGMVIFWNLSFSQYIHATSLEMNSSDTNGGVDWEGGGTGGAMGGRGMIQGKPCLNWERNGVEIRKILLREGRVIYSKKLL